MYNEFALRALKKQAEDATPKTLPDLLREYGKDPDALAAIQEGVAKDFGRLEKDRRRNPDDYLPDGYINAEAKVEIVDAFYLSAAPKKRSKSSAAESDPEATSILAALKKITARLDKLERRRPTL